MKSQLPDYEFRLVDGVWQRRLPEGPWMRAVTTTYVTSFKDGRQRPERAHTTTEWEVIE